MLELARFAATAKVSALERLAPERRIATLVAFVHTVEATAQDDALDLLEVLLTEELGRKARLRTLKDLDAAALQTSAACAVLLDPTVPDAQVRAVAFAGIPRHALEVARQQIARLVRPPEDVSYQELQTQYRRVRRFLPTLLRAIPFGASPAGEPVREALQYLPGREERGPRGWSEPPLAIVKKAWRHYVVRDGTVDPQAYTFCVLERLHHALRRRELFVAPRVRYADPRSGLLEGEGWASARPFICGFGEQWNREVS